MIKELVAMDLSGWTIIVIFLIRKGEDPQIADMPPADANLYTLVQAC